MTKILVLYYSMYGHVEKMAEAVAEGARDVEGAVADIRRVPDLMSEEALQKAGAKLDQAAPVAEPGLLADYDALIVGAPTRYGNMCAQMRNFFDRTGGLWQRDALVGKVASAFTSTATQHGGQETTLITAYITLLHLGYVIAGLPYSYKGQMTLDEIVGGSPYGAATIAGGDGGRQPSGKELSGARYQGRHIAILAKKLIS